VKATIHPLIGDYLRSLDSAARALQRREREELVGEIRDHIDAALPESPTEADIRNVLDQLGRPADIVAAARPGTRPVRRGAREVFALLLLVSGIPPIIGWVIGLGLLLWSPLWSARQKLLGALVWPGGYFAVLVVLAAPDSGSACVTSGNSVFLQTTCNSSGPGVWRVLAVVVVLVAPLVVATYLWVAAGRRSGD
jgi:hypothetical protein